MASYNIATASPPRSNRGSIVGGIGGVVSAGGTISADGTYIPRRPSQPPTPNSTNSRPPTRRRSSLGMAEQESPSRHLNGAAGGDYNNISTARSNASSDDNTAMSNTANSNKATISSGFGGSIYDTSDDLSRHISNSKSNGDGRGPLTDGDEDLDKTVATAERLLYQFHPETMEARARLLIHSEEAMRRSMLAAKLRQRVGSVVVERGGFACATPTVHRRPGSACGLAKGLAILKQVREKSQPREQQGQHGGGGGGGYNTPSRGNSHLRIDTALTAPTTSQQQPPRYRYSAGASRQEEEAARSAAAPIVPTTRGKEAEDEGSMAAIIMADSNQQSPDLISCDGEGGKGDVNVPLLQFESSAPHNASPPPLPCNSQTPPLQSDSGNDGSRSSAISIHYADSAVLNSASSPATFNSKLSTWQESDIGSPAIYLSAHPPANDGANCSAVERPLAATLPLGPGRAGDGQQITVGALSSTSSARLGAVAPVTMTRFIGNISVGTPLAVLDVPYWQVATNASPFPDGSPMGRGGVGGQPILFGSPGRSEHLRSIAGMSSTEANPPSGGQCGGSGADPLHRNTPQANLMRADAMASTVSPHPLTAAPPQRRAASISTASYVSFATIQQNLKYNETQGRIVFEDEEDKARQALFAQLWGQPKVVEDVRRTAVILHEHYTRRFIELTYAEEISAALSNFHCAEEAASILPPHSYRFGSITADEAFELYLKYGAGSVNLGPSAAGGDEGRSQAEIVFTAALDALGEGAGKRLDLGQAGSPTACDITMGQLEAVSETISNATEALTPQKAPSVGASSSAARTDALPSALKKDRRGSDASMNVDDSRATSYARQHTYVDPKDLPLYYRQQYVVQREALHRRNLILEEIGLWVGLGEAAVASMERIPIALRSPVTPLVGPEGPTIIAVTDESSPHAATCDAIAQLRGLAVEDAFGAPTIVVPRTAIVDSPEAHGHNHYASPGMCATEDALPQSAKEALLSHVSRPRTPSDAATCYINSGSEPLHCRQRSPRSPSRMCATTNGGGTGWNPGASALGRQPRPVLNCLSVKVRIVGHDETMDRAGVEMDERHARERLMKLRPTM